MVLCYIDDVISISYDPISVIDGIRRVFKLKSDKVELPEMYLGCSLLVKANDEGTKCWTMSSHEYIKQSIIVIEEKLNRKGKVIPKRYPMPLTSSYHPAEDTSDELNADET